MRFSAISVHPADRIRGPAHRFRIGRQRLATRLETCARRRVFHLRHVLNPLRAARRSRRRSHRPQLVLRPWLALRLWRVPPSRLQRRPKVRQLLPTIVSDSAGSSISTSRHLVPNSLLFRESFLFHRWLGNSVPVISIAGVGFSSASTGSGSAMVSMAISAAGIRLFGPSFDGPHLDLRLRLHSDFRADFGPYRPAESHPPVRRSTASQSPAHRDLRCPPASDWCLPRSTRSAVAAKPHPDP